MDSNWLAVLGVLLVVLAGGLAFVAFTHPAAFRENLGIPLAFLTAVAFIVLSFWNLGALHAQSEALLCAVKSQDRAASETVAALAQKLRDTYGLECMDCLLLRQLLHTCFFFRGFRNLAWSERILWRAQNSNPSLASRSALPRMLQTSRVENMPGRLATSGATRSSPHAIQPSSRAFSVATRQANFIKAALVMPAAGSSSLGN